MPAVRVAQRAHVDLDRINYVNVGLMLVATALACTLPFEVFLFSYAILGPLHYLTQISWLYDRGFYTTDRFDWVPLAVLSGAAFFAYIGWLTWEGAAFTAFGAGTLAAFVPSRVAKVVGIAVLAGLAARVVSWGPAEVLFVAMLATIVHVYVFTGLFMLAGSMRSRSLSGYLSLAVYVACGIGLLFVQPAAASYDPSGYVRESLSPFVDVIGVMSWLIPGDGEWNATVAIGRFLAFAYTYHYLNWFSKTGIIRWHEITRARMTAIGLVYVAAVAVYAYDYHLGLATLYCLSIAHVFLEFPLDARTLVEVVGGLGRARPAVAGAAARSPA